MLGLVSDAPPRLTVEGGGGGTQQGSPAGELLSKISARFWSVGGEWVSKRDTVWVPGVHRPLAATLALHKDYKT